MRKPIFVIFALLAACERERFELEPAVPVRTEVARRSSFTPSLTLLGVVRAAQSIPLTAQQRGTVRYPHRFANGLQTGVRVSRGEVIATVENDDVRFSQTQTMLEMQAAAADFDRARRSYEQGVVSSAEYSAYKLRATLARERYKAAVTRVATLQLAAPASGTLVVSRVYPPGTVVDPSAVLAEIATGGVPVVESSVAASERAVLHPGLRVTFIARAAPPWNGGGRIAEVAAVVSESGTARVVASIDASPKAGLAASGGPAPGTGVELQVQLEPRASALTVPEAAIVAGEEGAAVFVVATTEGRANRFKVKRVAVETGGRANGRVEITAGIHDGDRVVVSGADALSDDSMATEAEGKGGV